VLAEHFSMQAAQNMAQDMPDGKNFEPHVIFGRLSNNFTKTDPYAKDTSTIFPKKGQRLDVPVKSNTERK
jgi:hypothetical protein